MLPPARKKVVFWAAAFALVLAVASVVLWLKPAATGAARARQDIALGKPRYYFVSGVANAPPPASAERYRARGVSLVSTGCQALDAEQTEYNDAIAEHYRTP
jgi:hypothetical protein